MPPSVTDIILKAKIFPKEARDAARKFFDTKFGRR